MDTTDPDARTCETLDEEGLREELDIAENGAPTAQRAATGV